MKLRHNERGIALVEYGVMAAVLVVVIMAIAPYVKSAAGDRFRSAADSISQGQFDPTRGTFNNSFVATSSRNETLGGSGVNVVQILNESTTQTINQTNNAPADGELFTTGW